MKRNLLLGLLGVVVLAALAWWTSRPSRDPSWQRQVRVPVSEPGSAKFTKRPAPPATNTPPATPWAALESADPAQFLANLRAIGCPEQTIRDIMTFRLCREYRHRVLDLESETARSRDCTRSESTRSEFERNNQMNEWRRAMDHELETLLGASAARLKACVLGFPIPEYDLAFLTLDQRNSVREINQRYQQLTSEITRGLAPVESEAAEAARIRELNRQQQAELAKLLTSQELEKLNLRLSPAAQYVLQNLPEAKSEEEFRAMVQAVETERAGTPKTPNLSQRYAMPGGADSDTDRAQAEKEAQLEARLQEALGASRLAELRQEEQARQAAAEPQKQARDAEEKRERMVFLAEPLGISAEAAGRFVDRLQELAPTLRTEFAAFEKTLTGTPEEKAKQLQAAIQADMSKHASEIIGEKGPALVKIMMEKGFY